MPTFTDELWDSISHIHKAILDHPFLTGLTDGTLPEAAFRHYVLQDAHYLIDYARALAVLAGRAPDADLIVQFAQDAAGAILAERSLHAGFIGDFGLTAAQAAAVPVLPTTRAYTSYILSVVHQGSFADAVAAVLPCYWIYARVGTELLQSSSPNPLYARWIDVYGGPEFQAVVANVLALVDRLGPELTAADRDRFTEHVVMTSRYEWMFWDAAWRGEQWPAELAAR
ncbi:MAG: thiaminase [Frankiales bacterium]|nr:thiaminase [Frankiales bacterium]